MPERVGSRGLGPPARPGVLTQKGRRNEEDTPTPQAKRDDRSPVREPQAGLWLARSRQQMGIKIVWKACYRCGLLHLMLVRWLQSPGHKPGGFNHQKWILSQFWKPEVQTQGVTGPCSI